MSGQKKCDEELENFYLSQSNILIKLDYMSICLYVYYYVNNFFYKKK